ncbi:MAG: hypothetical protein U0172_02000 [Nitrospiraceae bacterium]
MDTAGLARCRDLAAMLCMVLLCIIGGGCGTQPKTQEGTTVGGAEQASVLTPTERADIQRKVQAELDLFDAGIQSIQMRWDQMSADTRRRAEASVEDLQRRKEEARRRLAEIALASDLTVQRLRGGLSALMDDIRTRYNRLIGER